MKLLSTLFFSLQLFTSFAQINPDSWLAFEIGKEFKNPDPQAQVLFNDSSTIYGVKIFRTTLHKNVDIYKAPFQSPSEISYVKIRYDDFDKNTYLEDISFFHGRLCFLVSVKKGDKKKLFLRQYDGNTDLTKPVFITEHKLSKRVQSSRPKEAMNRSGMELIASKFVLSQDKSTLAVVSGDANFMKYEGMNNWSVTLIDENFKLRETQHFFVNHDDIYLQDFTLVDSSSLYAIGVNGIVKREFQNVFEGEMYGNPRIGFQGMNYSLEFIDLDSGKSETIEVGENNIAQCGLELSGDFLLLPKLYEGDIKGTVEFDVTIYSLTDNNVPVEKETTERVNATLEGDIESEVKVVVDKTIFHTFLNDSGEISLVLEFGGESGTLADLLIVQFDSRFQNKWKYRLERAARHAWDYHESKAKVIFEQGRYVIVTKNNYKNANSYILESGKKSDYCTTLSIIEESGSAKHRVLYDEEDGPFAYGMCPGYSIIHDDKLYCYAFRRPFMVNYTHVIVWTKLE